MFQKNEGENLCRMMPSEHEVPNLEIEACNGNLVFHQQVFFVILKKFELSETFPVTNRRELSPIIVILKQNISLH
jgi:hypothetical protein